jgi:hypothetical protein
MNIDNLLDAWYEGEKVVVVVCLDDGEIQEFWMYLRPANCPEKELERRRERTLKRLLAEVFESNAGPSFFLDRTRFWLWIKAKEMVSGEYWEDVMEPITLEYTKRQPW